MKDDNRLHYRQVTKGVSAIDLETQSAEILRHIRSWDVYKNASKIITYINKKHETDTMALIKQSFSQNKRVFVPIVIGDRCHGLMIVELKINGSHFDPSSLKKGKFGNPEPHVCDYINEYIKANPTIGDYDSSTIMKAQDTDCAARLSKSCYCEGTNYIPKEHKYHSLLREKIDLITQEAFDVCFLPGVCFDTYGNRLGNGLGQFDLVLTRVSAREEKLNLKKMTKVGLCLQQQVTPAEMKLETDEWDEVIDYLITSDSIRKFP